MFHPEGFYKDIIFFDAECPLCTFWVAWILKRDTHNHFLFAPLQGHCAEEWKINHFNSIILIPKAWVNEKIYSDSEGNPTSKRFSWAREETRPMLYGASAILSILKNIKQPYPFISYLLSYLPLKFHDFLYQKVAHNRHFLFPSSEKKEIPKEKILD